jgi:hypothetical protein
MTPTCLAYALSFILRESHTITENAIKMTLSYHPTRLSPYAVITLRGYHPTRLYATVW